MAENNEARALALKVLSRIEKDSAFANLVLRSALDASELDERDKALVTELVYGVTRTVSYTHLTLPTIYSV